MTERLRQRRHRPASAPLLAASKAMLRTHEAERSFEDAVLRAARGGWSMREIGRHLNMSASTVWRAVCRAEERQGTLR